MEHFFEKLKTDEEMSDEQVAMAKEKFGFQGITFKQLMKTGDLAMTDAKLKEDGIIQRGLRTAILAVIKGNIQ
jgi:translation initiation factor 2 alpha subunit (eIF-2alpha)